MSKLNVLNLSPDDTQNWFETLGEKAYRGRQFLRWVHRFGQSDFDAITEFSAKLRERLAHEAEVVAPTLMHEHVSNDKTRKWLLKLSCGNSVETVYIPETARATLCVSSQVGCALACQFCSTAQQGFFRDLDVSEIIGQLWLASRRLDALEEDTPRISNVVFMGMGEPLLNDTHVIKAIQLMRHDYAYGLSKYKVTVSTSGIVPKIDILLSQTDASLAVSLHAPTNALRDVIVPVNKKYPLELLFDVLKKHFPSGSSRKVTFEYVMLDGINDSEKQAKQVLRLTEGVACKMNLIPFNPFNGAAFTSTPMEKILSFQDILHRGGLRTTVRKTRGDDVAAACGQLVGEVKTPRSKFKVRDIKRIHQKH